MESLTGQIGDMHLRNVADPAEPHRSGAQTSLQDTLEAFIQSAERTAALARRLEALQVQDGDALTTRDMTDVCSLHGRATKLPEGCARQKVKETVARCAVQHLVALGRGSGDDIVASLARCRTALVRIATKFLDTWNGSPELVPARLAEQLLARGSWEECVNVCSSPPVILTEWSTFWREVLSKCPHGSTLFDVQDQHLPPYLFRIFYQASQGRNDDEAIASQASVEGVSAANLDSLLGQCPDGKKVVAEKVFRHIDWRLPASEPDNLVSWTSSLLYALQYAVYLKRDPDHIKLCVVDTAKFARGQFKRTLHLIRDCHDPQTPGIEDWSSLFGLHLRNDWYNNGEYLSQGLVSIAGRCSFTSFKQLISCGLYKLYPEFLQGKEKWANRVLDLRRSWYQETTTTEEDLRIALTIAEGCFTAELSTSMACMLLCFKNHDDELRRKYGRETVSSDSEPAEVERFIATVHKVEHMASQQAPGARSFDEVVHSEEPIKTLRSAFGVSAAGASEVPTRSKNAITEGQTPIRKPPLKICKVVLMESNDEQKGLTVRQKSSQTVPEFESTTVRLRKTRAPFTSGESSKSHASES